MAAIAMIGIALICLPMVCGRDALAGGTHDAVGDALRSTAADRAGLLAGIIERHVAAAEALARHPEVLRLYDAAGSALPQQERAAALRQFANAALDRGFSLVEFRDTRDEMLAAAVTAPADAVLLFIAHHRYAVKLLWSREFVLHTEIPVGRNQRVLGTVYAQQPLPQVSARVLAPAGPSGRVEPLICGKLNGAARCSPEQRWLAQEDGPWGKTPSFAHPVERALRGESGLAERTEKGRRKIVAFTPVGKLGLGMLVTAVSD